MSTQDSDGIDEALQGVTHVAMTAAARMGEQLARMREQQAREAQARSEQAAREQAARVNVVTESTRAFSVQERTVDSGGDSRGLAGAPLNATQAREWARAHGRDDLLDYLSDSLRDVDTADGRRSAERAFVRAVEAERARADAKQQRGGVGDDRAEAAGLMAAASATDRAAEAEVRAAEAAADPELADLIDPQSDRQADVDEARAAAEVEHGRASEMREDAGQSYDSAERREAMAKGFDHIENRAAVDARVTSDVAQSRPATDAVQHAPRRAPKARKTRSAPSTGRKVQRPAQGR